MAFDGTIVLMPVPVKPPQIPTTSRVGRSHLEVVEKLTKAPCQCHGPLLIAAGVIRTSQDRVKADYVPHISMLVATSQVTWQQLSSEWAYLRSKVVKPSSPCGPIAPRLAISAASSKGKAAASALSSSVLSRTPLHSKVPP